MSQPSWQQKVSPASRLVIAGVIVLFNLPLIHYYLFRSLPKAVTTIPWSDDFSDQAKFDVNYTPTGGYWRVSNGALLAPGVKNNPAWLRAEAPVNVAIDVDALPVTGEGDVRLELAGSGVEGGSGYELVHGNGCTITKFGFVGTPSVSERLAQAQKRGVTASTLQEAAAAGAFRKEMGVKADFRCPPHQAGFRLHHRVERMGGELRWFIDGQLIGTFVDPFPLEGPGHDRVGLSGWEGTIAYDNFSVQPLSAFTSGAATAPTPPKPAGPFGDDFERTELGPHWRGLALGNASLVEGHLRIQQLRNRPVWLDVPLPDNARISLKARTLSPEGDVKIEAWGDGHSGYTGDPRLAYTATGYVFVAGGWKNTISVIARQHEHTPDRMERSDFHLEAGRWYQWVIERREGTLTWTVDGQPFLQMNDANQLRGPDNHFFGFSGWDTTVEFDDLVIQPL